MPSQNDRPGPAGPASRWSRLLGLALVAMVGLAACGPFGDDDYVFQGTELEPPNPAPALNLTDQTGQPFSLDSLEGKTVLLFFGYTNCPDVCPLTLSDFNAVRADLGDRAEDVAVVFVTVDPTRDTPERMAEYLSFFDASYIGLTGSDAEIAAAAQGYGVYYQAQESDSSLGYLVDHTTGSFVIDPDGNYRLLFAYGTDPAIIAEDVRHLF